MRLPSNLRLFFGCLVLAAGTRCAAAQSTLVLRNTFIEHYKNRATISVSYLVDHAHKKPNAIKSDGQDGDLHFAGRTQDVGLPMVAEIVNAAAATQQPAVDSVHQAEGTTNSVSLAGAWRIWFEHPPGGGGQQVQGDPVPVPGNTNPDHVFEMHPVLQVAGNAVSQAFVPIPGFTGYDAQTAFGDYEHLQATIQANDSATQITSQKAGHNYADFAIELAGPPTAVDDGYFVLATVKDLEGNTVVSDPRRMVFVGGTAPAEAVKGLNAGDQLHVLAIPRVNLERVSFAMQSSGGAPVTIPLPYEMIIVGVFPGLSSSGTTATTGARDATNPCPCAVGSLY
ncbi:MAG TPA: hypothetical protein VGS20_15475 [Candidatus Acidoferrales bacterium]|nr:hypothetical protein [Candidatus Acidoferrales bacterium]